MRRDSIVTAAVGLTAWWAMNFLCQVFVPTLGPFTATRTQRYPSQGHLHDARQPIGLTIASALLPLGLVAFAGLRAGRASQCARQLRVARRAASMYDDEDPEFVYEEDLDADDEDWEEDEEEFTPPPQAPFAGGMIGSESAFASYDYNFDPLGIADKYPQHLAWYREAELKHGRIAMLAFVGLVVPEIIHIPGPASCYSAKVSVVAAHDACVGQNHDGPMFQIQLFVGLAEILTGVGKWRQRDHIDNRVVTMENAGNYQLGLWALPKTEANIKAMKLKELKNGRLAMLAFGGGITQAVLSGNSFPWIF